MKPHYDDRDYFVPRLHAYEARVLGEIMVEQVRHIDLADYQPGAPHYEQLHAAMQLNQRFSFPNTMEPNI